jgi:hypothetical protein
VTSLWTLVTFLFYLKCARLSLERTMLLRGFSTRDPEYGLCFEMRIYCVPRFVPV